MDVKNDDSPASTDDFAALDDAALLSWRATARADLERLAPHSPATRNWLCLGKDVGDCRVCLLSQVRPISLLQVVIEAQLLGVVHLEAG